MLSTDVILALKNAGFDKNTDEVPTDNIVPEQIAGTAIQEEKKKVNKPKYNTEDIKKKAAKVLIKASPLIDLKQGLSELSHVAEIHVVSVKNECKEILFLLDFEKQPHEPIIKTINLTKRTERFDRHTGIRIQREHCNKFDRSFSRQAGEP